MINFFLLPEYLQYVIIFVNLLTLVVSVYCVVSCIIFEAHKRRIALNILLSVSATLLFCVFTSANFTNRRGYVEIGVFVDCLSRFGAVFIAILLLLTLISVISLYFVVKWRKEHITPASIKEGMDKLPAGLCYYNSEGLPKFINHRMDALCRELTGEPLYDADALWRRLTEGRVLSGNRVEMLSPGPIITVADGTTLSFTKAERIIGGELMYELRATDITTQYALYLELSEQNKQQLSLNRRLQVYGENVYNITREREILTAKVNIHDMLGKALLVTKRYIENGDGSITRDELTDMWKGTLYLFEGGFTGSMDDGSLDELYEAAELMGINLTVKGEIPSDNRLLRFIMSGARESLTNAVHHAKATKLTVSLRCEYGFFVIEYTNDGSKPSAPVSEGGGLSSLRQSVESEGGVMEIEIFPQFMLRLRIPTKEVPYV